MADEKKQTSKGQYLAIGIALGLLVGIATDNIPLWLCVGVAIGASYAAKYRVNRKEK